MTWILSLGKRPATFVLKSYRASIKTKSTDPRTMAPNEIASMTTKISLFGD